MQHITSETFDFLKKLSNNNNRDWFGEHKPKFKSLEDDVKLFFQALKDRMEQHDQIERLKVFRIYRDVRFSKDKTPYKTQFSASFSRAGAALRGGYYICVKPGASFIATGFWNPNKEDLYRIRKEWELDASELKDILNDKDFQRIWGQLQGEGVKSAPKGFDKEHPEIELIRKKQFIFVRNFSDDQVLSHNFLTEVDQSFQAIRPFFDLMSSVLTTNLNGESLID